MNLGIHTKELDRDCIDGTRVYLYEVLSRMISQSQRAMHLYHQDEYSTYFPLGLGQCSHVDDHQLLRMPLWTQTQFATALMRDHIDVLWMPLQNMPRVRHPRMRTVVTIHDLAFLKFPETFTRTDLYKLVNHANYVARHADHIIAVSDATKKDILRFYPKRDPDTISVVHHGFDPVAWHKEGDLSVFDTWRITKPYILYVGTIQPRKNLNRLIVAFAKFKETHKDVQLVIAGSDGWMAEEFHRTHQKSAVKDDIICTGHVDHEALIALMREASLLTLVSLYEGFGIPILEAYAAQTPVLVADNSSLREVAGEGALYCDAFSIESITEGLLCAFADDPEHEVRTQNTRKQLQKFSWEDCARQTMKILLESHR